MSRVINPISAKGSNNGMTATENVYKVSITDEERKQSMEREIKFFEKQLMKLPPNVRNAMRIAQGKKRHTDFFYKLIEVNNKIRLYNRMLDQPVVISPRKHSVKPAVVAEEINLIDIFDFEPIPKKKRLTMRT